jgi:V/A-type H+-transporting ATPase subunit I
VKPIESVLKLIAIRPGYREADISAAFLLFFSLFFAMLVGDGGYGLLFLAGTFLLKRKLPKLPASATVLLLVLSICTILWGVVTGNYFGIRPSFLPPALAGLRIGWLADQKHMMKLCFVIGAVHLMLAHVWNALRVINSLQVIAQIGWICLTWGVFSLARFMVLGEPFPGWAGALMAAGAGAIVLFMTPVKKLKSEWINHAMLPFDLINSFVDIMSYIRLFAVGTASLAMAQATNDIAASIGFGNVLTGLASAVVLFIGHTINVVLCFIGVLVHGVRLNALEFSGHMGLEWSGFEYSPFASVDGPQQNRTGETG